jgi:hypothetical protein
MKKLLVLLALLLPSLVFAQNEIDLTWDAVVGADGYKIFCGTSSRNYTMTPIDVLGAVEYTVPNLVANTEYFCAVKAYNSAGDSINYSREVVSWPEPAVTALPTDCTPIAGGGSDCTIQIAGANFNVGITATIPYPGVTVVGYSRLQQHDFELHH